MAIQTRYIYLLKYILPVVDLAMLNVVYIACFYITADFGKLVSSEMDQNYIVTCNLIWLICSAIFGLYSSYGARKLERIYRATWRSVVLHFLFFTLYLLFSRNNDFSRTFLVIFYVALSFSFILNRFVGTSFQYVLLNKFNATKKVAVMGSNHTAVRISNYLQKQRNLNFYGFIGDDESIYSENGGVVSEVVTQRFVEAIEYGVQDVYVAIAPQRMADVKALIAEADRQCLRLKFIPDLGGTLGSPYTIDYLGGEFPIITLRNEPLEMMGNRFKKRAFDVLFSGIVILFVLSWLYPIIAILIKIQSKGPVLFKQQRSGRNDEPFWCYKFRSMKLNNESNEKQATKYDDRITPVGRFLRRTSLDEMPQFFNVFFGSMSVVGPRPHMLKHTEQYKEIISHFMVRHFLKPGITGWAQVNGYRGETKEKADMENRVKCDIYYLENWTGMLDVKIVFMTVINAVRGEENAF
ncbi:undecaprenyl-phosphate glucose phosphotransferase [Pedobacter metabolipauper]|uniref:Undecaprenyl-phosphate galactose phosphotransferase/putative colanic acid biosynthesis UDP-glucose lipid carrier transferase n=1 Tax=Pedobacter metabolipauper TaxID=425513 RepID=A0A4R6SZ40_9SPHI|nr:undecaprenyl-phosphate glucose phosphotransferase [Pedobacter metabolipauper]TDQ10002.1 undecaprenyl-phosphate galactose phosphotransferase/putative colanic acid biosynthesis UDP-glucose lipid carrier transferase [Pedobacter metabolipauper]